MRAVASIAVVLVGAALDLGAKAWARASLEPYGPPTGFLPLVPLRLTFNKGVSFSMFAVDGEIGKAVLIGVTGIITLVIAIWAYRSRGWQRAALSMILAGALGNLIDRSMRGAVTDFLSLRFGEWEPFVFNPADVWISSGVALLLVLQTTQSGTAEVGDGTSAR